MRLACDNEGWRRNDGSHAGGELPGGLGGHAAQRTAKLTGRLEPFRRANGDGPRNERLHLGGGVRHERAQRWRGRRETLGGDRGRGSAREWQAAKEQFVERQAERVDV